MKHKIIISFFLLSLFNRNILAQSSDRYPIPQKLSDKEYHGFVILKFKDGLTVRLKNQQLQGIDAQSLNQVNTILESYQLERLFHSRTEEEYDQRRAILQQQTGETLNDMNLYFSVSVSDADKAWEMVTKLNQMSVIDTA